MFAVVCGQFLTLYYNDYAWIRQSTNFIRKERIYKGLAMIGFCIQPMTRIPKNISTPQLSSFGVSHGPGELRHRSGGFNLLWGRAEQLVIPVLGEPLFRDGVSKKKNKFLQSIGVPHHSDRNIILSRFGNEQQVHCLGYLRSGERDSFRVRLPL